MLDDKQPRLWRSRWAAIGAAVAVTLGAGGLATTFADSPASSLVAISPVRVLDTRLTAMAPALTSATPRLLDVTGAIPIVGDDGRTVATGTPVPDGATAIVANVTIVEPTTAGFVSVRPGTATGTPTTSSLNATAAGVIVPNSVTVEVPTTGASAGQVQLFFQGTAPNATTHLLVDIVGYYQAGGSSASGFDYVGSFNSAPALTGIGDTSPAPPDRFTPSFDLPPGRYFVTGNLTVRNTDTTGIGSALCRTWYNDDPIGVIVTQDVNAATALRPGRATLSFADTFVTTTAGPATVSFRCVRDNSTAMFYEAVNLTLFSVG